LLQFGTVLNNLVHLSEWADGYERMVPVVVGIILGSCFGGLEKSLSLIKKQKVARGVDREAGCKVSNTLEWFLTSSGISFRLPIFAATGQIVVGLVRCLVFVGVVTNGGNGFQNHVWLNLGGIVAQSKFLGLVVPFGFGYAIHFRRFFDAGFTHAAGTADMEYFGFDYGLFGGAGLGNSRSTQCNTQDNSNKYFNGFHHSFVLN
jgi:hypothetical protein